MDGALQLGRAKDKLRVGQLVQARIMNMETFADVIMRYGLNGKWATLSATLLDDV